MTEEQRGDPERDCFLSSSVTGIRRFSARWLGPGGGRSLAGTHPDRGWNVSQSPSKFCFQTCPWLSWPVLPPAFPSLYHSVPQAGASPAASPGPVRGSQVGLQPWLHTMASGASLCPPSWGWNPDSPMLAGTGQALPPALPLGVSNVALEC